MHLIAHLDIELDVREFRNTGEYILDKSPELLGHHDPRRIAEGDLVGSGLHGGSDRLTEEGLFCPRRVKRGKLHMFTVIAALLYFLLNKRKHSLVLLMTDVFHLYRRNRDQQVQLGLSRNPDAVPGLLDISVGDVDTGGDPAAHHGSNRTVAEFLRLAPPNGRQLNCIRLQSVQAPGDFQLLLKGQLSPADRRAFAKGNINQFHRSHTILLSSHPVDVLPSVDNSSICQGQSPEKTGSRRQYELRSCSSASSASRGPCQ